MKIMIINPNTTETFTKGIEQACLPFIHPKTELVVTNPKQGVKSIEGAYDGIQASFFTLQLIKESHDIDAFVIACFDDTGLDAAREVTSVPVIGIGEAALHAASFISRKYSVLTTMQRSVNILKENAERYGLDKNCVGIHAANLPVLALEDSDNALNIIYEKAKMILEKDQSECLILGCGGMSGWASQLSERLNVPVVDGVIAGMKFAESLVEMNLSTSKAISYDFPREK